RSAAVAIFVSGATIGLMVGLMLGGYVAEHYGWRSAFVVVGLVGAPVSLLTSLVLKEPIRGRSDGQVVSGSQDGFIDVCRTLLKNKTYVQIVLVVSLMNFMLFGVAQWMPALMMRKFDLSI